MAAPNSGNTPQVVSHIKTNNLTRAGETCLERRKKMVQKLTNKLTNRKKDNKGFTLVELIVVIVILAILAAILIPGLLKWIDEARDKQYQLEARSIYMAAEGELTKAYGNASAVTIASKVITIDATTNDTLLPGIKTLSGLDVTSVKATVEDDDDWTITAFETAFKSSDGKTITKAEWTADSNEWKITK